MKQEFYNLQINTSGQKLYEFTNDTIQWISQNKFTSSTLLEKPFKRTISRLYELTSKSYN